MKLKNLLRNLNENIILDVIFQLYSKSSIRIASFACAWIETIVLGKREDCWKEVSS